jgi:YHS domain-containing protein
VNTSFILIFFEVIRLKIMPGCLHETKEATKSVNKHYAMPSIKLSASILAISNRYNSIHRIFIIAMLITLASCKNQPSTEKAITAPVKATDSAATATKFTPDMVDNKKDFACGMPVTAGIDDTCHYNNKVYGFCSKECKEEFLKNPKQYLTAK